MQSIRLREKGRLERESWNPDSAESEFVWHFSIPNFDDGGARAEEVTTIKSGKTLITKPCVLVSKLNPSTPRVWLIEHLKPGVNVCSTEFLVVVPIDSRDLRYLYFALKSPSAVSRLTAVASGSSTSHQRVRPSEVEALELGWEESSSRRQWVADCLWEIEEKIRANSHTSRTIEELAAALFKSWFIDFDPVKAKMAGEAPVRMDAEMVALFPDSTEESELGEIPSGWVSQPLDSIAEYLNGLAMQKFPVVDDSDVLPVIKIAQLRAGHTQGADFASGSLEPRYVIEDGDILFSWSGTLEVEHWTGGKGALNQHLFKVTGTTVPDWFAYFATRSFLHEFRAIASSKATTMGHIQRKHLKEACVAVPPSDLLEQASEVIGPMISLRIELLRQNKTLGKLRDSLLPRLISGKLEIPEEMLAA